MGFWGFCENLLIHLYYYCINTCISVCSYMEKNVEHSIMCFWSSSHIPIVADLRKFTAVRQIFLQILPEDCFRFFFILCVLLKCVRVTDFTPMLYLYFSWWLLETDKHLTVRASQDKVQPPIGWVGLTHYYK